MTRIDGRKLHFTLCDRSWDQLRDRVHGWLYGRLWGQLYERVASTAWD